MDSVAKIYAIVIGPALTESVKTLIGKTSEGQPNLSMIAIKTGQPAFIAILATLVPFWHGMN